MTLDRPGQITAHKPEHRDMPHVRMTTDPHDEAEISTIFVFTRCRTPLHTGSQADCMNEQMGDGRREAARTSAIDPQTLVWTNAVELQARLPWMRT